jgi:hypothetical protein
MGRGRTAHAVRPRRAFPAGSAQDGASSKAATGNPASASRGSADTPIAALPRQPRENGIRKWQSWYGSRDARFFPEAHRDVGENTADGGVQGDDGRKFDEIRPIWIESACCRARTARRVFTRGETQALVTARSAPPTTQQKIETVDGETWKRFMLHYNFPPFSVGEVKFHARPGRREIGHGALAERALRR